VVFAERAAAPPRSIAPATCQQPPRNSSFDRLRNSLGQKSGPGQNTLMKRWKRRAVPCTAGRPGSCHRRLNGRLILHAPPEQPDRNCDWLVTRRLPASDDCVAGAAGTAEVSNRRCVRRHRVRRRARGAADSSVARSPSAKPQHVAKRRHSQRSAQRDQRSRSTLSEAPSTVSEAAAPSAKPIIACPAAQTAAARSRRSAGSDTDCFPGRCTPRARRWAAR
jgi:hypothetical protein